MSVLIRASQISLFLDDVDEANPLILLITGTKEFCLLLILSFGQIRSIPLYFERLPSKIFQMHMVSIFHIQNLRNISTKRKEA